jgi:hypothetical protein
MAAATHLAQPERTQQIGLLTQGWFGGTLLGSGDSDPIFHSSVVLGPVQPNWIAVRIEGWYDALEPIVWTYSADASQTYFLYPKTLSPTAPPRGPAMLVMTFDRAGLEHAAASATRSEWAEVHSVAAACGGGR